VNRCKGLFILDARSAELIYGPEVRHDISGLVDIYAAPQTAESVRADFSLLADTEVIFSGWGGAVMDAAFLEAAPKLRAVFYGSGSIRRIATDAFWERDILITSAYAANAVPVAEYTLGTILLSLKNFWRFAALAKQGQGWGDHTRPVPGGYRATVGLISFGMIARKIAELLRAFDVDVLVYCPFLSEAAAQERGVRRCSIEEIFRSADVISLHTPELPETLGMITGELLASMKPGATFINTARGAVVREHEMIDVLARRPDLTAVLDVTDPEPPAANSRLLTLPNVVLTPHIAGSMGREIQRLGRYMVEELQRYLAGEPLRWRITRELAEKLA
jgi:phosphoglycerate dehydrogenase-like enzyme